MTKRALLAVAGFLGLCLSLPAQAQGPEQLLFGPATLNGSFHRFPSVALTDQDRVSFMTAFNWQTPVPFLPPFNPVQPESVAFPATIDRGESLDNVVELRAADRVYVGGEVGFFYGRSSGKYGYEDFQTYIIGTVGTEKFSITAGFLHQESNGRFRRWQR
jgi:hypothetical protein